MAVTKRKLRPSLSRKTGNNRAFHLFDLKEEEEYIPERERERPKKMIRGEIG